MTRADTSDLLEEHLDLLLDQIAFEEATPPARRGGETALIRVQGATIRNRPGHRDTTDAPFSYWTELAAAGLIGLRETAHLTYAIHVTAAGYRLAADLRIPESSVTTDDAPLQSTALAAGAQPVPDVFISYAGADRVAVAEPLVSALDGLGISTWYDRESLVIGDPIHRAIDQGMAAARVGVVVLSEQFLERPYTKRELDGLTTLELSSPGFRLLPIWHGVTSEQIARVSPPLASRFARNTATTSISDIASEIAAVVRSARDSGSGPQGSTADPPVQLGEPIPGERAGPGVERASVAVHWVGVGSAHFVHDIPTDPLATAFVTLSRARELLSMNVPDGPLVELGEAPEFDDEAGREWRQVRIHLGSLLTAGASLERELRGLAGPDDLHPANVPYWKKQVREWDAGAHAYVLSRLLSRSVEPPAPGWGDVEIQTEWPTILADYVEERLSVYGFILMGLTTEDLGYVPRVVDPSTRATYQSKWGGRSVTVAATPDGLIVPRNREEVALFDGFGWEA